MTKRRISAGLILLAFVGISVSVVLLLNFTAPNPTGRRYSSEVVKTSGSSESIGVSGERVLSKDLGVPRNDRADLLQCFCNSTYRLVLTECRVCLSTVELTTSYRRPDFVAQTFIGESKNAEDLLYTGSRRESTQLSDYALASRTLGRPLWVFVRVDSAVDPEFVEIVETTGGGVVQYFRTSDSWVDPIDSAARVALLVSLVVFALGLLLWFMPPLSFGRRAASPKPAPKPSNPVGDADDFLNRARDKARKTIDKEDSRPHG